jgi:hypothetical protein
MDGSDVHAEVPSADQIEEDWERALDTASEAVSFCARSGLLTPADAAHEVALIRAERTWLVGMRPTLRGLFPSARFQR